MSVMQDGSERIRYRDPSIPIYVVRGDLCSFPNMAALCHWHEDVELLLPLKGYLSYNINGQQVRIEEGNGIFINSRQIHYGYSVDGTDCEYICIAFRPELLCANPEIRSRYVLPVLTNLSFTHLLLERQQPAHASLLETVRHLDVLYSEAAPGYEMEALGKLYEFWQRLYTIAKVTDAAGTDENVTVQKRMLEYIRTHYQEQVSLKQIASSGGVCRSKCCQLFRKYLGRSPIDYLNSFRLEQSMGLLKGTELSVTEIAYGCGFGSPSYFAELFAKQKGCTPTAYRKQ